MHRKRQLRVSYNKKAFNEPATDKAIWGKLSRRVAKTRGRCRDVQRKSASLYQKQQKSTSDLEALSRRLGVEVEVSFSSGTNAVEMQANGQIGHISWLLEKITLLERQILDKEAIIEEKERAIKILSGG